MASEGRFLVGIVKAAVVVYLAVLLGAAVAVHALGDRWWFATVLLFSPRWILGLPLLVLGPAALARRRWLLVPLAAGLLLVLGPVMGFTAPGPRVLVHRGEPADLRVMTGNLGGGSRSASAAGLDKALREVQPDVAAFQECGADLDRLVAEGWFAHSHHHLCLVSRFPIRSVTAWSRAEGGPDDGRGSATAYVLDAPGGAFALLNLHLPTVRDGLFEVMHRGWRGAPDLVANIDFRRTESRGVADFAARAAAAATIVVGDFNMPVESSIYREVWSAWTNAFSRAGVGFGWTKYTRWHGVRIDHVLHGPEWDCRRAWVGPGLGLDHRPLVADLVRTRTGAR